MNFRLLRRLIWCLPLIVKLSFGADARNVGQPAPPIELQEVFQVQDGGRATWAALRGKVVVLEFWATWCPTCVRCIPHFNALADELKGKPVQFIAITDEPKDKVVAFLAGHPIHGWVGLNTSGSMFRSYGIEGRPMTIIVRPDGVVDARISPFDSSLPIGASNLLALAAGRPSGLVSSSVVYAGEVHDDAGMPIPGVTVRATNQLSEDSWRMIGQTVTGKDGRFRIDRDYPPSYVNADPVRLEFMHPNYLYGRLEDLRLFSPRQQTDLHLGLQDGNTLTGKVVDPSGRPVPRAPVRAVFGTKDYDRQDAIADAQGVFELHGLPAAAMDLRALVCSPGVPMLGGHTAVDLRTPARSAVIEVSPVLPPGAIVRDLLGMKVIDVDKGLQSRLFLPQRGILVLDPGPHPDRIGMGQLRCGDCFWAVQGKQIIDDIDGFSSLILDRFTDPRRTGPVRLVCGFSSWPSGDFSITALWDEVRLTEAELQELRTSRRHR